MPDSRGRILVVDDNHINRMLLGQALTQQGYSVAMAENGRQALACLTTEPFDLVLLDILMPEMDGYETLARIKQDGTLHHIPVIMISAVEEMASVVRCIEMGATDYLPKPFEPSLLRARINASLAEKRLRDLEREYLEQVGYVANAAVAVQAARFDPASLDRVAARDDALGQLARVFQHMAREVHLREQRLKQQLQQLHADVEEMRKALVEPLSVYLPMDRRQALARGETLPDRTTGAALFADISGFTSLTAALCQELGLQRGAEELTHLLNEVYDVLISEVHAYCGSVIGFSGDAITCWLDGDDGLRAVACALAMQRAMAPLASIATAAGTHVSLAIKVAVASGPVRRFLVGDPHIQVVEAIAGRILDQLARGEQRANPGEVVVTADVVERTGARILVAEWRLDDEMHESFAVVDRLTGPVPPQPWPDLPPASLPDMACRPWLAPAVGRRLSAGGRQFLAELRPAVALFLSFRGIDFEADDRAGDKLDALVRWAQAIVHRHEGTLIQLTLGDKGSYLYAAFGAPLAHADDEVRAVQAALALQAPPADLEFVTGIQIGIAKGRMRTGAYGSTAQRTYGILGDKTNLAARLMQAASAGILCDEEIFRGARGFLTFQALPPIHVKGWAESISVYQPTGEPVRRSQSQAAIQASIDALSPAEQLTLKVASLAGSTFTPGLLAALSPELSDADDLDRHLHSLERLRLVERDLAAAMSAFEPAFSFSSPAVRNVAYEGMLFSQRRHLHRLAAEWFEQTFHADLTPHYAILAHHWCQAEEPSRAIEYLELAGRQAQQVGDYEEAERCFRQCLELEAQAAVLSDDFYAHPSADWDAARNYALQRLERELPLDLTYHNLWHTRNDVAPAAMRLAAMMGIEGDDAHLLETAALFHDIGYTVQRQDHERIGAEMAAGVLPGFGFSPAQVAVVQGMIMATKMPQSPQTLLEDILVDADLDVLGREDFQARSDALRFELASSATPLSDQDWYAGQIALLENHRYRTAAARGSRDAGKLKNLELLRMRFPVM